MNEQKTCLYQKNFPDIEPPSKRCKDCSPDYNTNHHPNNYDCPNYFPYPPISLKEVYDELKNRGHIITKDLDKEIRNDLGLIFIGCYKKHRIPNIKKVVDNILEHRKLNTFIG